MESKEETATFAAGCFWGVEAAFTTLSGIIETKVGYTGGKSRYKNPSYEQVCTSTTGHAESIQIIFDPKIISYEKLLDVFWQIHDPTQINRQGPDIGSQYRSAIFYHSIKQRLAALKSKSKIQKNLQKPITTEITKASLFYPAENYHQKYFLSHPNYTCHINFNKL